LRVKLNTMKKLVVSLLVLMSFCSYAQDEIYFADGKMEEGKVLEVDRGYLIIRNAEGVKLKVEKIEIAMVIYENGSYEIFNKNYEKRSTKTIEASKKPSENSSAIKEPEKLETPNQLKFNLAALAFGSAELSYQRKVTNGIALEIPMSIGWADGSETFYFRKKYSFGFNLLFYPMKSESQVQIHLGPGFEGGNGFVSTDMYSDFRDFDFSPLGGGGGGYNTPSPFKGFYSNYINVGLRFGVSYKISKAFGLGAEGGVGIRSFVGTNSFIMPIANFNFNLQYHF